MADDLPKRAVAGLTLALLIFGFPWVVTFAFMKWAEAKFHIKISGDISPRYIPPNHFELNQAKLVHPEYGILSDGQINITYNPILFPFSMGRLQLEANDMNLEPSERFRKLAAKDKIHVRQIQLEIDLQPGKEPIIDVFSIDSSAMRFELRGAEAHV